MQRKKWLYSIIAIIFAVVICGAIKSAVDQRRFATMPCDFIMPSEFALPESRLVAVGTATHGNSDPFAATLAVLQEIYETHGAVALILEENVGDAETVSLQHAYSGELGQSVGYYLIYENREMSAILRWLEENNQRLYGVDIQNIEPVVKRVTERLIGFGFTEVEGKLLLASDTESIEKNFLELDTIEHFLNARHDDGSLSEQEYDYLLHQVDCIRMHYEYRLTERSHFDVRDEMMAKNTEWVMEYEQKYYNNDYAVLLGSNGHVVKTPWKYENNHIDDVFCPMGVTLDKNLGKDYFVIITDAAESYFTAGVGTGKTHQKIFHITREDLPIKVNGSSYFTTQELLDDGHINWDMTMIGATTTTMQTWDKKWYAIPVKVSDAFDALLLSDKMTSIHKH